MLCAGLPAVTLSFQGKTRHRLHGRACIRDMWCMVARCAGLHMQLPSPAHLDCTGRQLAGPAKAVAGTGTPETQGKAGWGISELSLLGVVRAWGHLQMSRDGGVWAVRTNLVRQARSEDFPALGRPTMPMSATMRRRRCRDTSSPGAPRVSAVQLVSSTSMVSMPAACSQGAGFTFQTQDMRGKGAVLQGSQSGARHARDEGHAVVDVAAGGGVPG